MWERLVRFVIWLTSAHGIARYDEDEGGGMLYYSNGGPGPATKLLRVDAPSDGNWYQWRRAPAERWTVKRGWQPELHAQLDIAESGDFTMIDESQVARVQQEMRTQYEFL